MGQFIDRDRFEGLMAMAEPLMALALEGVDVTEFAAMTEGLDDATAQSITEIERGTQAVTVSLQAVLLGTNLPEIALILALATATGTIIGQAGGDRALLWSAFKERSAKTIQSVALVQAPTEGSA